MNKWNGNVFLDTLQLTSDKSILEIGIGTGRLVISIDRNQAEYIDMGDYQLRIFPDTPYVIRVAMEQSGLQFEQIIETDCAYILCAGKE